MLLGSFGRVFENPNVIFPEDMLKPELQSLDQFADGIMNIVEAQQKVAESYFRDGSINSACPPLKALLHIMAYGNYEGKTLNSKEIREMFTYGYLINSEWYKARLLSKQQSDVSMFAGHIRYIERILREDHNLSQEIQNDLHNKLIKLKEHYEYVCSYDYAKHIHGTIGRDIIRK